jgi:hypothetical protein
MDDVHEMRSVTLPMSSQAVSTMLVLPVVQCNIVDDDTRQYRSERSVCYAPASTGNTDIESSTCNMLSPSAEQQLTVS